MESDRPATRPAVLTIDDDPEVLKAIERDLRHRYAKSYRILSANSGQAALDLLDRLRDRGEPVALLLADHRMRWLRLEVHKPIAGGGYTMAALNLAGVTGRFTYVSTAGGASSKV